MRSILILTKTRYILRLSELLPNVTFGTIHNEEYWMNKKWDVIVSYCYGRKIKGDILKENIFNLHPAPLPKYKGGDPYADGERDGVMGWEVTLHRMTENYDEGEIIDTKKCSFIRKPTKNEIWFIAHSMALELLINSLYTK